MTVRQKATEILERMYGLGISPDQILEHILYNFLSGSEALEALEDARDEFIPDEEGEIEDDYEDFINEINSL